MSIKCDVIVQWNATSAQLNALGAGLWRWCARAVGRTGIYQLLDDQALADLIAGRLPTSRQAGQSGVHLYVRDEISPNRQATIASLRREIPVMGLVDIMVDGASWNSAA
jgi:hypothetical protein